MQLVTRPGVFVSFGIGADEPLSDPHYAERVIELAREARIDLLLLGTRGRGVAARFDPLIAASWLAPRAGSVGLIPLITGHRSEPFHVARALSALDHLTGGRSGWLPATGSGEEGGAGEADAVARATELVAATLSLWDSWDSDALIIDAASGVYLDPSKVRPGDYRGAFFKVLGPLNAARPPQGHPVLVQFDTDPASSRIAADVLITDLDAPPAPLAGRLARRVSGAAWDSSFIDELEQRWRSDRLEGIHLLLSDPLPELAQFAAGVLPELVRRGMRGDEDSSGSLRTRLGLRVPEAGR